MMWRRRRSVVNAKEQFWFGLELIVVAIGFNLVCAFLLFVPPMSEVFSHSEDSSQVLDQLLRLLLVNWPMVLVAVAILFVFGILMSHRISGPLYSLQNVLKAWRQGDRLARIRFRKYDYLVSAMNPVNAFLDDEQKMIDDVKRLSDEMVTESRPEVLHNKAQDIKKRLG